MLDLLYLLLATPIFLFVPCVALPRGLPYPSRSPTLTYGNTSHRGLVPSFGQDHTRLDDLLSRRDFVWTDTTNQAQNLCGTSTFASVGSGGGDSGGDRPCVEDCRQFVEYAKSRDGFWLVTGFSDGGRSWMEFATLASCKIGVRRTDAATGIVPIGNQDVIDLLNSIMGMYGDGDTLPATQGNMSCCRGSTAAAVEWHIYNN